MDKLFFISKAFADDYILKLPSTISFGGSGEDPTGDVNLFITNIFQWIFAVLGVAAFIGIVYSGFMMVTSGGDATKFAVAKKNLLWSVIGVVVIAVAYMLVGFVYSFAKKAAA